MKRVTSSPYLSVWDRLVKTVHEPENEQGCWIGRETKTCKYGYKRINLYVPGLQDRVAVTSHVLLWVCLESGVFSADDLYLAYLEFRESGLTIDHLCYNTGCRNPDHLEAKTFIDNIRNQRRFK